MKWLITLFCMVMLQSCQKLNPYVYCDENPCQYNDIAINGKVYRYNTQYFRELNGASSIEFARVIHGEFPVLAEIISFDGIPDTTGVIYLREGTAWSGYPVTEYGYFEEDVTTDIHVPFDRTSSWLYLVEKTPDRVRGTAHLRLYSGESFGTRFYGDVDTLNIFFEFDVTK